MGIPKDFIESIRMRPAMYCGDVGEYGLHHLVYFLLDVAYEEARRGESRDVVLELGGDGSVALCSTSRVVSVENLVAVATGASSLGVRALEGPPDDGWGWGSMLVVSLALSSRYQVDTWADGQQWRLLGEHGRPLGEPSKVTPREPMPVPGARGIRVYFVPDATIFEVLAFDRARLSRRCNELAALAPGLRVSFVGVGNGERSLWHLPGGVAQWAHSLTEAQPRLHPEPIAVDLEWGELRVQCAFQWCEGEAHVLRSFANTVRTVRHGAHVDGLIQALRSALAKLAGTLRREFPWSRVSQGLTAIVAVSGPQRRMAFAGPTKELLAIVGLEDAIRKQLKPRLVERLRNHPVTPKLLARRKPVAR
ncbi:DNA gyrase subunit B [Corallococcus macrosporus]|uniref:DNA topoisomerase (ATP-hydrolyzing) n=1 Tax=Corallococcus macrosporus DSM 14697 TaxID=1189310 RepID=A0A250K313_9BACT|nr:DNA gyrase subunit B [Corallococcus macrosporus]ATB50102.1 DNA gyrase subunit B [Corallococcus macrosporus DSM 14697]